jgi:hypothetical protein
VQRVKGHERHLLIVPPVLDGLGRDLQGFGAFALCAKQGAGQVIEKLRPALGGKCRYIIPVNHGFSLGLGQLRLLAS